MSLNLKRGLNTASMAVRHILGLDVAKFGVIMTNPKAKTSHFFRSYSSSKLNAPEAIMDIDVDDEEMMEYAAQAKFSNESEPMLAPQDIDAWEDEEEVKQGTVDIDAVQRPLFEYPPIPKERSGVYQFRGLKVILPQSMLQNEATYRWRVDPGEQKYPDDLRICNFQPIENEENSEINDMNTTKAGENKSTELKATMASNESPNSNESKNTNES